MPALPVGTVTFLAGDIADGGALRGRPEEVQRAALARYDALAERCVKRHGGAIVHSQDAGGGRLAAFAEPADAVAAAAALQTALRAAPGLDAAPGGARLAVHTGEADLRAGSYAGRAVERCARLCTAAHGGQTLLSRATWELVRDRLPPGVALRDLGERRLTDLVRPEHLFQLDAPGLPADFPPPRTLEAYPTNLPLQPTPFVGREGEVAAVRRRLLHPDVQLVTLTGVGGTGKTRLGLQVAAAALEDFADGVFFVPLAALRDPALVPAAIAQALGVGEAAGQPLVATLDDHLRGKRLLLVLDNFEQLLAAAAPLARLLVANLGLKALVTSRAPLQLRGERTVAVGPLVAPDPGHPPAPAALAQYDAVRLFIERARDDDADFAITDENAPAVAAICRRLEGLPLALELAAARLRLLSPAGLLARLEHRLRLLTGGARDLPARHQTLRATLDWSYDLLEPSARRLFARLAVFAGGATLEALEAIGNVDGDLGPGVLDEVTALADQSLLRQREETGSEPRLGMLEIVREYALERLKASGEGGMLRRRHAVYYLALAEKAEPELHGPEQAAWLNRLEREHDNLRAALSWSLSQGEVELGLRLAGALWRFWDLRGHLSEGRGWLDRGLAESGTLPPPVRARALHAASLIARMQGDFARAVALNEESLVLFRELGDTRRIAHSLIGLGWAYYREARGDTAGLAAPFEESRALFAGLGDQGGVGSASIGLGCVALLGGDYAGGMVLLEESRALCQGAGNWQGVAHALYNLGWATLAQGAYARARTFYEESLARFRSLGDQHGLTLALEGLAALAAAQHQGTRAARLLGAAAILHETTSGPLSPVDHARYEHYLAAVQARLDDATWAAAWVAGRELSLEQVVEEALTAVEATAPAAPVREAQRPALREDRLTPREIEVLCLIAAGRPNAAIAEELFVDENTVERHITNLYQKIKDTTRATKRVNRVAAVNYAKAQGICPSDP